MGNNKVKNSTCRTIYIHRSTIERYLSNIIMEQIYITEDQNVLRTSDVAVVNNVMYSGHLPTLDLKTDKISEVQAFNEKFLERKHQNDMAHVKAAYGLFAEKQMNMERTVVMNTRRLGGLPSNMLGAEILMDFDCEIRNEDYLGFDDASVALKNRKVAAQKDHEIWR